MNIARRALRPLRRKQAERRTRREWSAGNDTYAAAPAPETPRGWVTGAPDFVGIAAARCGTSWWYANIRAHPGVSHGPGRRKELRFFHRFVDRPFGPADIEEYHRFFARAPGTICGEWTVTYHRQDRTISYLRACGNPKVLFSIRDPVERAWSHMYATPFWAREPGRPPVSYRADRMLLSGWYADSLRRVLTEYDRRDILLLQYERCLRDTRQELRRTYEFLGLDPDFDPAGLDRPHAQPSGRATPPMPPDLRDAFTHLYRPYVEQLLEEWPEIDGSLWPNFAH